MSAKITNINDNYVNIVINDVYDGIISINELTWLKKPPHPSKIVSVNEEIEVVVLEIDDEKKRISARRKPRKRNCYKEWNVFKS